MTIQLLGGTAHSGVQLTPRTGADPRRGEGFEESCWERLQRVTLGLAWALKPRRILGVPGTLAVVVAHYAGLGRERDALPDPESALRHPDGLTGICRDMSVETLLAAYARGLFPFCHAGPMKWWAPSQRMVLLPHQYHIEKNLRRRLRQKHFRVTFDQGFEAVMRGCA